MLILFFFMASLKAHASPMEETVMRHAYGVIFQRQGRIEILKSKWTHHFDLELMQSVSTAGIPIQTTLPPIPCQQGACVIKQSLMELMAKITERAYTKVNEQIDEIHEQLQAGVPTETKRTRSPFSFIGTISHALFGTATDEDLEAAKQQIIQLMNKGRAATEVLEQQIRELTTATSLTNKRIEAIKSQVDRNVRLLTDLESDITTSELSNMKALGYMSELLLDYVEVGTHLNEIKIGINELVSGRLSPTLIPQTDLQRTLSGIDKIIKGYGPNNRILADHANFYYRKNDHVAVRYDNRLLITIKVPIGTYNSSFELYKVISYPQAVSIAHNHSTIITGLKSYFAINQDQTAYAVWEEKPTLEMGEGSQLIWEKDIQIRTDQSNCILSLFKNKPEEVFKLCDFVLINRKIANALSISRDTVLLENVQGTKIVCQNSINSSEIESCTSCIIKIAKGCYIETNELRTVAAIPQNDVTTEIAIAQQTEPPTLKPIKQVNIQTETLVEKAKVIRAGIAGDGSPSLIAINPLLPGKSTPVTNQRVQESQSQISHSLNLAIVQSFFAKEKWEKFKADLTVPEQPLIELPEFTNFRNSFREAEKADKNLELQLETALDQVRKNEPIFEKAKSEYDYSLDTEITAIWKHNFWKLGENIGFLVTVVVEVIILIIIVYILIKLHQITILIMSQSRTVYSERIVLQSPTTSEPTSHCCTPYQSIVLSLLILIISLVLLKILLKIWTRRRKRNKACLGLKIENGKQVIILNWFSVRKDISDYNILAKNPISGIKLQRACFGIQFKFEWKIFLQDKDTDSYVTLPNEISVPRRLRKQLQDMIEIDKQFSVTPVILKKDGWQNLDQAKPLELSTNNDQKVATAPLEPQEMYRRYPELP